MLDRDAPIVVNAVVRNGEICALDETSSKYIPTGKRFPEAATRIIGQLKEAEGIYSRRANLSTTETAS